VSGSIPGALNVHSADPLCAGPSPDDLIATFITPNDAHYVRNHGPAPVVDPASYRLVVSGLVNVPLELSLDELAARFERSHVVATLQCAGNRRSELHAVQPFEREVMWGGDAIGTADWSGVRLADVLSAAGVALQASHVWFDGLDRVIADGSPTVFGSSIGLDRALHDDVVLAYEMNGARLPPEHGAPLRVVIPGAIGARSVKWLGQITVSDRPSENHFQRVSYRMPTGDGGTLLPIDHSHLNSYVVAPADGSRVAPGPVRIAGYAVPSRTCSIVEVGVALDDRAWQQATLLDTPAPGTWTRWELAADLTLGTHEIRVRARDSSGAEQSAGLREAWNPKGYGNDAIHAITVHAQAS
jgi:sulfite oxidase